MSFRISRRTFLITLLLSGCSQAIYRYTQPELPDSLTPPDGSIRHPIAHLLNRATYGSRPGQIQEVEKTGREAWINQQLDYTAINDNKLALRIRRYDSLNFNAPDLMSFSGGKNRDYIRNELAVSTLMRAIYSERQLYEVMVGFWTDHFNLYHYKGDVSLLKTLDDREVVRKNALRHFKDMLKDSAHSPAMLVYLDNILNEKSHPNENYAREIMELHTLGVDGGYTEADIKEVARCFTGWSVDNNGKFTFIPEWHDREEKVVLGHTILADGGKNDGDRVLDILIEHPSTARHVCTRLVRRFVADDPPPDILDACIRTWHDTDGHLREIVQTLLTHPDFDTAPPKLKRPFELLVSLLRGTNARYNGDAVLIDHLEGLGHRPFGWPTPDGYPDTAIKWSGNLLGRWNLCLDAFHNLLPGVSIDSDALLKAGGVQHKSQMEQVSFLGRLLLNRNLTETEQQHIMRAAEGSQLSDLLGLLGASPAFQWR